MVLPDDLRLGIKTIADQTGYSQDEVLRFMLEEEIRMVQSGSPAKKKSGGKP